MQIRCHFLLMFAICWTLTSGHILRLNCEDYGNFSVIKENHVLQGFVVAKFVNLASDECENQCFFNNHCMSINIERDGAKTCELNSKSTVEIVGGEKALVPKSNWTYKATDHNEQLVGKNCHYFKPCNSGQVCMDSCICPGYQCLPGLESCKAAQDLGYKANTVYTITNSQFPTILLPVFCDLTTAGGGWIVFQRRIDDTVDFYRNWTEYKHGFGETTGNFWIGLANLHVLAAPGRGAVLRVDLRHRSDSFKVYALYSKFEIGSEDEKYKLNIGGYSGNAGDSMSYHNNMKFTTRDMDHDKGPYNCAEAFKGGWWYNWCHRSNLNGIFPTEPLTLRNAAYISWYHLKQAHGNIVFSEMKLRHFA